MFLDVGVASSAALYLTLQPVELPWPWQLADSSAQCARICPTGTPNMFWIMKWLTEETAQQKFCVSFSSLTYPS